MKEIFEYIYNFNVWKNEIGGTATGPGSCIECSNPYIMFLEAFVKKYQIKSMLDLGCGDFNLMKHFNFSNIEYLGIDIVDIIIEENNKKFSNNNIKFISDNILSYKPEKTYDLVIIKDVLQHFSNTNVISCIKNINYCKYILITNDYTPINKNCKDGEYRQLNLYIEPYSMSNIKRQFEFDSCGYYKTVDLICL